MTPPPASVSSVPAGPGSARSGIQPAASSTPSADDSGMIDLAAASMADPQAALRAQQTPLASQGLFDDEPAQSQRPPMSAPMPMSGAAVAAPAVAQPVPSTPPPPHVASLTPTALPSVAPHAQPQKKGGNGALIGLLIAGIFVLGAAGAGTFLYLKMHKEPVTVATMAAPTATLTQAPTAEPPPEAPTPASEGTVDPATLPTAAAPKDNKAAAAPKNVHHAGAPVAAAPKTADAPKDPPKVSEKDLPTAPTGPAGALGDEMRKAVGDKGEAKVETKETKTVGNVPTKPSQGAVTGALGAVLPGARACLGPDDPISRASVVFSSDGNVQSVSVSGGAAGKPAEPCIKSALMKAKVAPFADATYTAPVTIRHN